jgi:hypothetical protein
LTRQQQPDHPGAFTKISVQGPNLATLPQVGAVLTHQEQPGHPSGSVFSAPPVLVVTVRPPVTDRILLTQEPPWHPGSMTLRGVQPNNASPPPQVGAILGRQEQPWQPLPFAWGAPGAMAAGPRQGVTDRALTVQEAPWHPSGNQIIGQNIRDRDPFLINR